jgi:hypothetical protein
MNTPPPVDLSRLKGILGNAKAIINKTTTSSSNSGTQNQGNTTKAPDRDGYDPTKKIEYLSEADMINSQGHGNTSSMGDPTRQYGPISEETIMNSKLPEAVKKAMLENQIPQATINHTFNLNDVSDLVEQRPAPQLIQNKQQSNVGGVVKNDNDTFTVSEAILRGIIKDVVVEYLTVDYAKNLTEATIKKTINTLIREGKIKTKPKQ